jgi:hypothetical protein
MMRALYEYSKINGNQKKWIQAEIRSIKVAPFYIPFNDTVIKKNIFLVNKIFNEISSKGLKNCFQKYIKDYIIKFNTR